MADRNALERLLELQVVDSSLDQGAYKRSHLDERQAFGAARAATVAARGQLQANADRRAAIDAEYSALEAHARDLDSKAARLEGQMRNVVVTREAEAIQRELATLRAERDEGDERGLGLLDEAEALLGAVDALQGVISACEEVERAAAQALADAEAALDAHVQALRGQRAELVASLPAELLGRYEEMRPSFRGIAVAALQGSRCTGCHLDLSRVELEAVRAVPSDDIPECPQCARILVLEHRS